MTGVSVQIYPCPRDRQHLLVITEKRMNLAFWS